MAEEWKPTGSRLAGKTAIVTGASSGYGLGIALTFLSEGAYVVIADLNPPPTDAHPALQSDNVLYQRTDVTSRPAWDALIGVAIAHGPSHGVDVLVNNAGTSYKNKPTLSVTEAEFDLVMRVNVKSVFHSIGSLFALQPPDEPSNVARAVSIVNIASTGSHRPRPGLVWYNASKGAVLNATKGLAGEYGPYQVRVNAILPLLGATALFSTFTGVELGVDPEETKRKFIGNVPMGRLCTEGDVAGCALWLAGGESRFVTGQGIEVDGGKCIG